MRFIKSWGYSMNKLNELVDIWTIDYVLQNDDKDDVLQRLNKDYSVICKSEVEKAKEEFLNASKKLIKDNLIYLRNEQVTAVFVNMFAEFCKDLGL